MIDTFEHDGRVAQLRKALACAVQETGSLTNERVLRVSTMLDQAILAYFREEQRKKAGSQNPL